MCGYRGVRDVTGSRGWDIGDVAPVQASVVHGYCRSPSNGGLGRVVHVIGGLRRVRVWMVMLANVVCLDLNGDYF